MTENILKKVGVKIGHFTDAKARTGTTVFLMDRGGDIGIDIRGSGTGTFNTPAFDTKSAIRLAHGIVLTGGSLFGLESVFGVMQFLEENKVGFHIDSQIVPSVTGAVIYDLGVGNPAVRPSRADGYYAAKNASYKNLSQGAIGAGTGATVGKWNKNKSTPGGFGMDFVTLKNNIIVTAFVVTNAIGNIINPKTNSYYYDAGSFDESDLGFDTDKKRRTSLPNATTLAVIATNVDLNRPQLMKVAELAHDGMARSIYPVHTSLDGDTIFAISSLNGERMTLPRIPSIQLVDTIGILAGKTLASAIKHSIASHGTIEP